MDREGGRGTESQEEAGIGRGRGKDRERAGRCIRRVREHAFADVQTPSTINVLCHMFCGLYFLAIPWGVRWSGVGSARARVREGGASRVSDAE